MLQHRAVIMVPHGILSGQQAAGCRLKVCSLRWLHPQPPDYEWQRPGLKAAGSFGAMLHMYPAHAL